MKPKYSAFHATHLSRLLEERGIDTLVVCGLTTECCIGNTVSDAFHRDYHVVIADDASAAYGDDIHRAALAILELNCAILRSTAEIEAVWRKAHG